MKQKNSTKRTLALSLLVMLLCVAMLVGTTFAWFTDSATSSGNKIKAGTLNIDLLVRNDAAQNPDSVEYVSVKNEKTAIFNYDKWEPGYTEVRNVMVKTTGNLALKYTLSIVPKSATADALKLAEVIDVYYASREVNVENRDLTGLTRIGTLKDVLNGAEGTIINDTLIPDQNTKDYATIVLKMQESAGNDYQGLSVGDGFDLNLVATQYTYEEDSFDDQYDANAQYPYPVSTDAELAEAIATVTPGSVITLTPGTFALPTTSIGEGVTIAGDGADKTTVVTSADGYNVSNKNVAIKDVTVDGTAASRVYYAGAINLEGNNATIENCVINGGGTGTWGASVYVKLRAGETAYIKNTKISGGFRGIFLGSQSGSVVVDNCDIDAVYPINVDGGGNFTVTVTNSKLHGWTSYAKITKATFTNTEFSKGASGYDNVAAYTDTTFTNCTFDSSFIVYAQDAGFNFVFNNCTKDGTPVTAENFKTLFPDDSDVWTKCICTVNGVQVTA